jgi:hypothetical protein
MTGRPKISIVETALLISPAAVNAGGLYLMSAGRIAGIEPDASVKFLLFLPWQALGITIVKCGVDSWILSRAVDWPGRSLELRSLVLKRYVPLALAVGFLLCSRLAVEVCVVAAVTALMDALAAVLTNEMAAQARVKAAGAASMLKFPLFFGLTFVVALFGHVGSQLLLVLFFVTSALRLCLLLWLRPAGRTASEWPKTGSLALQQVLNYGLFKNDQLATGIINRAGTGTDALFVYLARFPELISVVVTATGPLIYPQLYAQRDAPGFVGMPAQWRTVVAVALVVAMALVYAATGTQVAAHGAWPLLPAVTLSGLLVVPVNYRTYALLREQHERQLVAGLLKGNLLGVLAIGALAVVYDGVPPLVLWVIPAQQILFLWATRGVR